MTGIDLFVCITCREKNAPDARPGIDLCKSLESTLPPHVRLTPVECLNVCTRPCTVAVASPGKWSYVIGGLAPKEDVQTLIDYLRLYGDSSDGVVAWEDQSFPIRKGTIARIPGKNLL